MKIQSFEQFLEQVPDGIAEQFVKTRQMIERLVPKAKLEIKYNTPFFRGQRDQNARDGGLEDEIAHGIKLGALNGPWSSQHVAKCGKGGGGALVSGRASA